MPPKFPAKERAWGTRYDTLGTSPPPSPPTQRSISASAYSPTSSTLLAQETQTTATVQANVDSPTKTGFPEVPHDASIFVGSLPANVDHAELTQQLSEHLAAYLQIKAVKVVRDTRGGVCAFVQCDSPAAAGDLLRSLQTHPPLPFLGRFLRFEPAKAFRALLVSYRVPSGFAASNPDDPTGGLDGRSPSLRLAYAMRIFRPRNTKHLGLLYDSDAIKFQNTALPEQNGAAQRDPFSGNGVLISPMKYDAETLRTLATCFGPLESFVECQNDRLVGDSDTAACVPYRARPHDAPRSSEMEQAVWEIKWKDRESSVAALLTLRRVPHLTVSWAHHPPPFSGSIPQKTVQYRSPGHWISPPRGSPMEGQDMLIRGRSAVHVSPLLLAMSLPSASPSGVSPSRNSHEPQELAMRSPSVLLRPGSMTACNASWADQLNDSDPFGGTTITPSMSSQQLTCTPVKNSPCASVHDARCDEAVSSGSTYDVPNEPTSRSNRTRPHTPHTTPSFANAAGTSGLPLGLTAKEHSDQTASLFPEKASCTVTPPQQSHDNAREYDPTTVFVGGLDMSQFGAWDENRLRSVFNRFGPIEDVHIVRPLNKRSAFAFVRFTSPESASRAMQEEHNRMHDGRPIRVQLRDRNPCTRGTWRGRGRGRPLSGGPPHLHYGPYGSGAVSLRPNDFQANSPAGATPSLSGSPQRGSINASQNEAASIVRGWQERVDTSLSSMSSSTTKVPSSHYGMSQGTPSTTASPTPPPTHPNASLTAPSGVQLAPCPMNMGFFAPPPWVHPYAPYPYHVPVVSGYGFAGYPCPPTMHPMPPAMQGSGGPTSFSWGTNGTPQKEPRPADASTLANPVHQSTQPPLRATGFVQNEQGALVPVYQRDALDQYMANASGRTSADTSSQTPPQSQMGAGPLPPSTTWHQPPPFAVFPGTYFQSVAPMPSPPVMPPANQQRFWMPAHGPRPFFPGPPAAVHSGLATAPRPSSAT